MYGNNFSSFRIANECVKNREARIGIDLVKDEVENSLEREVENIKTYQQRMQKMLARVNQQIETNHSMQVKIVEMTFSLTKSFKNI